MVRPLAAWRSPTGDFRDSAAESLRIHIFSLSAYHSEHPAYQLEFDCIHHASVWFALFPFPLVVGTERTVMINGGAGGLGQDTLYLSMSCGYDMIASVDGTPGLSRYRRHTAELGVLPGCLKPCEITC